MYSSKGEENFHYILMESGVFYLFSHELARDLAELFCFFL